ncbi:glutamine--fructose-6-phosphate transaminase (isomerizing) [Candidatus Peribacteria bacterium]|nr:glutamine--fructose-6-phosphate transaminase (isomerizing) [Candidatus Peribacteria bacterium]
MCGIFGYTGPRKNAGVIVIKGLKNLEYRGYDSWGVAMRLKDGTLSSSKEVGKIGAVRNEDFSDESSLAIAHSRWATHGGVTKENAHPHFSGDQRIAVVHNGIIENFEELRRELEAKGHTFASETDTEVIPHLIEELLKTKGTTLHEAVRAACKRFVGRYAILVMDRTSETLVAARTGSPLIVGVGEKEFFIASDIPAFLEYTRTVEYLDDGEMVTVENGAIRFQNIETGEERAKRLVTIDWTIKDADKGEYEHYMMKEIMDQKQTIQRAVHQDDEQILKVAKAIETCLGCILCACGTAGKVCMAADYFFSVVAKRHVNFAPASEFPIYHHFLKPESLIIVVSQSGETADVLEAMKVARQAGSKVLAIVNTEGSSIARAADFTLLINAGPERAVASTKAATGQMAVLLLIAHAIAGKLNVGRTLLLEASGQINDMLNPRYIEHIRGIAQKIAHHENMYIIGKGWNYPMALESAIKIQEVSYIHAEGFAAGELKHGPIALIEEGTPCIALMGNDEFTADILSNIMELKARGAYIIAVSPVRHDMFDLWIKVPDAGAAQPIVNIIPIQILAYSLAVLRGKDPDMPRNLAKSVTVK